MSLAGGYDVVVVGDGQAGLSMGYRLVTAGLRRQSLDAHAECGASIRFGGIDL